MFGAIVDTVIGLVLIFLLFSILVTTVMEAVSGALKLRAQALENSIAKLIEDPPSAAQMAQPGVVAKGLWAKLTPMFGAHLHDARVNAQVAAAPGATQPLLSYADVYNHPLVAGTSGTDRPSYVPAANFALALIQVLASKQAGGQVFANVVASVNLLPAGDLKTTLETLIGQAAGNLDALKAGIETWFDSAMDRLSGQYKRFTQVITFAVALILAILLNVDTLHAFHEIYADPVTRATLGTAAEQQIKSGPPTPTPAGTWKAVRTAQSDVAKLEPVGWVGYARADDFRSGAEWFALALIGWLITAIAAMMGAPFWFDALNTFVNIRNAGPKPDSSTSG
jgi:hypothetical protein